ncbi:MAG: restriction endonuclease [Syntrophobacteraceae bacterium]
MPTLYLIKTRARKTYSCSACQKIIHPGTIYFRHDPIAQAWMFRGQRTSHWCFDCITASDTGPRDPFSGRLRISAVRVTASSSQSELVQPVQIEVVGIGTVLTERILSDPNLIHQLKPEQFEDFICDRLFAMGFQPTRVGNTYQKDGGIDVIFWPRINGAFPILGAAQVKHHKDPNVKEPSGTVRDFAGAIAGHSFNAGILVTNTSFSPDAEWFARERAKLVRLRDFSDIRRWLRIPTIPTT